MCILACNTRLECEMMLCVCVCLHVCGVWVGVGVPPNYYPIRNVKDYLLAKSCRCNLCTFNVNFCLVMLREVCQVTHLVSQSSDFGVNP